MADAVDWLTEYTCHRSRVRSCSPSRRHAPEPFLVDSGLLPSTWLAALRTIQKPTLSRAIGDLHVCRWQTREPHLSEGERKLVGPADASLATGWQPRAAEEE
jgi:hypothetical protein